MFGFAANRRFSSQEYLRRRIHRDSPFVARHWQDCFRMNQSAAVFRYDAHEFRAHDPVEDYAAFVAAVARRDSDGVLDGLCVQSGAGLRRYRERPRFAQIFDLWCQYFPEHLETIACYVDGDTAILETNHRSDAGIVTGRVTMVHERGAWRVSSERCAGGRTRIPVAGFVPCISNVEQPIVSRG
jgi:hypothetical protein